MKQASVSEAKNQLSALLDHVKNGASVLILDRGRAVARLEGVSGESGHDRLARLERAGALRRARGPVPAKLIAEKPPSPKPGASALDALREEREGGR
jgi:antitoxin (DNA-binding transcriptional repressor) of toxin-antitoxin stability system